MKRQYNVLEAPVAVSATDATLYEGPKQKKMAILTSYPSPKESLYDVQVHLPASISRPVTPADKIIDSLTQGPPSPAKSEEEIELCSMTCTSPIASFSPISCPTPVSTPVSTAANSPLAAHSPLSIDTKDDDDNQLEITGYLNPFTALHFTPLAPFNNAPYPFAFVEPPLNNSYENFKSPPPIFLSSLTGKRAAKNVKTTEKLLPSPEFLLPPSQVGTSGYMNPARTHDSKKSFPRF